MAGTPKEHRKTPHPSRSKPRLADGDGEQEEDEGRHVGFAVMEDEEAQAMAGTPKEHRKTPHPQKSTQRRIHFASGDDQSVPRRKSSLALLNCSCGVLLSEVADLQRMRISCAAEGNHKRGHQLDEAIAKRFRVIEEQQILGATMSVPTEAASTPQRRERRRSSLMLLSRAPAELANEIAELQRLLGSCENAEKRETLQAAITKHTRIMIEQQLGVPTNRPDEISKDFDLTSVPGSPRDDKLEV